MGHELGPILGGRRDVVWGGRQGNRAHGAWRARAMSEPLVLVERRGRVGILTLNRPEVRNAINLAITEAMADAIEDHEADGDVWVHVITGSGEASFCAGTDLKE